MYDLELSAKARVVYLALDEIARDSAKAYPSQKTLTAKTGFPERTIQRCIAELRDAGHITVSRRNFAHGPNLYELNSLPPNSMPLPPTVAGVLPPTVAGDRPPVLITEELRSFEERKTPIPTAVMLSQEQFDELADAFDRHLKHHRTEPRDTVLQMVMDQAQRGVFDWAKFRERHRAWCDRQAQMGWQYATITFLGWIRAGMPPPAPEIVSGRGESATDRAFKKAAERVLRTGRL